MHSYIPTTAWLYLFLFCQSFLTFFQVPSVFIGGKLIALSELDAIVIGSPDDGHSIRIDFLTIRLASGLSNLSTLQERFDDVGGIAIRRHCHSSSFPHREKQEQPWRSWLLVPFAA